ncbi:unnamed protein product, partial [marine sediment metagenome]
YVIYLWLISLHQPAGTLNVVGKPLLHQTAHNKGQRIKTSVGRIIFNDVLPPELGFYNKAIDKSSLKQIVTDCYKLLSNEDTA